MTKERSENVNYYVVPGQDNKIVTCPKSNGFCIGPFETLEAATEYVAEQERFSASRIQREFGTATDFRIRSPK